jgi:hypothetical protein
MILPTFGINCLQEAVIPLCLLQHRICFNISIYRPCVLCVVCQHLMLRLVPDVTTNGMCGLVVVNIDTTHIVRFVIDNNVLIRYMCINVSDMIVLLVLCVR